MGFDFFKRWSLVALLASSLVAADAFGQRGERGERGGGGGGRGGGERSFSGGGGGGGGRGGGGGGGDRGGRGGGGGGGGRSFSGGRGGGSRSSDRGSSRQSFEGRSSRGSSDSGRSFRGGEGYRSSGRGSFDTGRSAGRSRDVRSMQRDFSRDGSSDARRQFDRQQFSRSQQFRDSQGQTFRSGDRDGMRSARSQWDSGRRDYQVQRPTEDQVRDYLRLRRDGGQRQAQDFGDRDFRRGDGDRFDREFRRDGSQGRRGDFAGRDFGDRDFGDRDVNRQYQRWRDNAWSGDGDRRGDHRDWSGRWRDGDRFVSANRIRDRWRDRDRDDFPFRGGWWNRGWGGRRWDHWNRWSHNRPWYWWAWVTAPRLTGWFDYGWRTPYYWDYGPGEYIYYDDGAIYVNGRWHQPAPVFYDQTVELIERAPDLTPEEAAQMEWLPLGVFAVTRDGQAEADVLLQLAVTQDGVIGGTASDQGSGAAYPVEGIVDKETQRAVWSFTDDAKRRVVMETSIFNLTQPEATGLVHNGPNDIQVIELVRLEAPQGAAAAPEGELPTPPPAQ